MKLVTFTEGGTTRIGVVTDNDNSIVDLAAAVPDLPREMTAFLIAGPAAAERAQKAAKDSAHRVPLANVKLEAPIRRPPEFLAIGLNYADHVEETKMKRPEFPMFFNKQSSCVTGPWSPSAKSWAHWPNLFLLPSMRLITPAPRCHRRKHSRDARRAFFPPTR